MLTLRSSQTEQPLLKDLILPVPKRNRETKPLVVITVIANALVQLAFRHIRREYTHEIPPIPSSPHLYALLLEWSKLNEFQASPFSE